MGDKALPEEKPVLQARVVQSNSIGTGETPMRGVYRTLVLGGHEPLKSKVMIWTGINVHALYTSQHKVINEHGKVFMILS